MSTRAQDLVVGFDCGGTSTRAAIADWVGRVLGRGRAGPSNYLAVGMERARDAVAHALRQAIAESRTEQTTFAAAAIAMAGAGANVEPRAMNAIMRVVPARRILVDGDIVAALTGAFPAGVGLVVIAGTGSVAFGISERGTRVQVGGWGYLFGDEGSGYAIGLHGLRAVLEAHDGRGVPTPLMSALLHALDLTNPVDLIRRAYIQHLQRDEIAALAPHVASVAADGDPVAQVILTRAGNDLARLATTGVRRLAAEGTNAAIAPCGGLFDGIPAVAQTFRAEVRRQMPDAAIVAPRLPPLGGAVLMALREAGYSADDQVVARMGESLE